MPRRSFSHTLRFLAAATVLGLAAPAADAIVVRDDREDARYLELGKKYPAAVRILPDGAGVLVAPEWVLTAAHVARGVARRGPRVEIGGREISVARVFVDDRWNERAHDIALLRLAEPVEDIEPVALYTGDDEAGRTVVFVGHGDTGTGLTGPKTMDGRKRGATNVVTAVDDDWVFFRFDRGDEATDLEGVSGPGDSGGPALIEKDGKLYTLGVSVFADGEGGPGRYGIKEGYTRVSTHLPWIRAVMAGEKTAREIEIGENAPRRAKRRGGGSVGRAVAVGGPQELPDTAFGAVVGRYVEIYNSNDAAAMKDFIAGHFDDAFRASRSDGEHLDLYRTLYGEYFGKITLRHVVQADDSGLTVLFDSETGKTAEFRFSAEGQRIGGMRVGVVEVSVD